LTPLSTQFLYFALTVGIGLLIGVAFDLYRILRGLVQPGKIITNVGDLFFWLLVTILAFVLLIFGNRGEVRFYVFIGIAVGLLVYLNLLSKHIINAIVCFINLVKRIIELIKRAVAFLVMCVTYPIKIVYRALLLPVRFIKGCYLKAKKSLHKFKQHLRLSLYKKATGRRARRLKKKAARREARQRKLDARRKMKAARKAGRKQKGKKLLGLLRKILKGKP